MKRVLLSTMILFLALCSARPEDLKWFTWNEGYDLARKEGKPMLVFVHATWCNTCKRLNDKTFNDEKVKQFLQDKYIPVKIDVESKEEYQLGDIKVSTGKLLMALTVDVSQGLRIPTTVLWQAGSKKAKVIAGLLDPDEMVKTLSKKIRR